MDKHPVEQGIARVVKTYELLDRVRLGRDIMIRDDQFEAETLLDAARMARAKGIRMSLLDTGRFDRVGLERLIMTGVRIYTSDEARPAAPELDVLLRACRAAKSFTAYFHNGPLAAMAGPGSLSFPDLGVLAAQGMDVHLSNSVHARDFNMIGEIAANARAGRSYFVYYHHGAPVEGLAALAARGTWIHFSDRRLGEDAGSELAVEIVRAAAAGGSRAAVHVEAGLPLEILERLFAAGAVILFLTPPSDYRSLARPLERKALRRRLPVRAWWQSTAFLP
jgi:hypothetical protein